MEIKDSDFVWAMMFAPEPGEFYEDDLNDCLDLLFKYNVRRLRRRARRGLPPLRILQCSLRYIPEKIIGGIERQWWPHYWILRRGGADCKGAAAAYAAEMVVYDGDSGARPFGELIDDGPDLQRFHARVRSGTGKIIDPSEFLERKL